MNLSYWEIKTWLSNIDYTIVGSGIVGLNCALQLKQRFQKSSNLDSNPNLVPAKLHECQNAVELRPD